MSNAVETPAFHLLRGGHVYAPADMGVQDVLCAAGRVIAIGDSLSPSSGGFDVDDVDVSGRMVVPGLVDGHIHIAGGGGEAGPATRNFDIQLSQVTRWGVTTAVGLLGVDCTSKQVGTVLAKAMGLEQEGISAFAYVGGYTLPSPTLTGSVTNDIAFVDRVVGVKLAISDHRCSQPSPEDIFRLAAQARMGGLIGGKAGLLHLHVGHGREALGPVLQALERSELPVTQFLPTHMNRSSRHMRQAVDFGLRGGRIDITAGISPHRGFEEATCPCQAVRRLLDAGVGASQVSMSSDANGNAIMRDAEGNVSEVVVQSVGDLLAEVRHLVRQEGVPVATALEVVTSSPARALRLPGKGRIATGADADIAVLDQEFNVEGVYARGRTLVRDGKVLVRGLLEPGG